MAAGPRKNQNPALIMWTCWVRNPEEPLRHEAKQNPGFRSTGIAWWVMGVFLSRLCDNDNAGVKPQLAWALFMFLGFFFVILLVAVLYKAPRAAKEEIMPPGFLVYMCKG